jgi:hypothetical protein
MSKKTVEEPQFVDPAAPGSLCFALPSGETQDLPVNLVVFVRGDHAIIISDS